MPYVNGEYVMPGGTDPDDLFKPWHTVDDDGGCGDPTCDEHPRKKRQRKASVVLPGMETEAEATEASSSSLNDPKVNPSSVSDPGESNVRQSNPGATGNPLKPWLAEATRIVFSDDAPPPKPLCEILPWLYLGDVLAAGDVETLQEHRITHVLNAAGPEGARQMACAEAGAEYMQVDGKDRQDYDMIGHHWDKVWTFVQRARTARNGKLLIHCVAGVNRSGLLATAALMVHAHMPVLEALHHVHSRRGEVLINSAFRESLVRMAAQRGLLGPRPVDR